MTLRTGRSALLCAVAVTMMVAGCGGEDEEAGQRNSEETTTQTSDPVITAPPTKSPEEKAEAEIIKTFEDLIADRDEFYSNASDYGNDGDVTWNAELVGGWQVEHDAEFDLTNQVSVFRSGERQQVGEIAIATHEVTNIDLNTNEAGGHGGRSVACLDMTELEYETFDGGPVEFESPPSQYQTWTMTWTYYPTSGSDQGDKAGWYLRQFDLDIDEPC